MWQLLILSTIQALLLSFGQLTLKLALARMPVFAWTWEFWSDMLTNWWFLACGLLFGGASLLWIYILKHFPLNMAYPLASLSYVIAIILAVIFLHESVPVTRWIGVALIMIGCIFISN